MKKQVMVVDNHPLILRLMSNHLENRGYEVLTAEDGLAALELLKEYTPEIVFADLVMPNIGGDKLCRIMRAMPKMANAYIVLLSGIAAEEQVDHTAFGANACIAKGPFKRVTEHIQAALEQAEKAPASDLTKKVIGIEDVFQREITRELLASQKHFEIILDNMAEGIFELAKPDRIVYLNPAALALFDLPEEELLGRSFRELFDGPARGRLEKLLAAMGDELVMIDDDEPVALGNRILSMSLLPVTSGEAQRSLIVIVRDLTEQNEARRAVASSEGRFLGLFNHMSSGVAIYRAVGDGADFEFVDFNPAAERIERLAKEEVIGRRVTAVFPGIRKFGLFEVLQQVWRTGEPAIHPVAFYMDDRIVGARENYVFKLPSGEVVAVYDDVTKRKQAEDALTFEANLNEAVARLSAMLIAADSVEEISNFVLEEAKRLTGSRYGYVGYVDQKTGYLHTVTMTRDIWGECQVAEKHTVFEHYVGLFGWVLENKSPLLTNNPEGDPRSAGVPAGHIQIQRFLSAPALLKDRLIGQVALANADHDYTERDFTVVTRLASLYAFAVQERWTEEKIEHLAHHDVLTGLVNRRLCTDRLEQAVARGLRLGKRVALFFIDLNDFKPINDRWGHEVGDRVLRQVGRRLRAAIRRSDTVARVGGDEFVVIIHDLNRRKNAVVVAEKILGAVAEPIEVNGQQCRVHASIGIAVCPDDGDDAEQLQQRADRAMYRVKRLSQHAYCFFDPSLDDR